MRFLGTGAAVGLALTVVTVLVRGNGVERPVVLFFYLGLLLIGVGALIGGLVAVLLPAGRADGDRPGP